MLKLAEICVQKSCEKISNYTNHIVPNFKSFDNLLQILQEFIYVYATSITIY